MRSIDAAIATPRMTVRRPSANRVHPGERDKKS
jgi:hypothetical protein